MVSKSLPVGIKILKNQNISKYIKKNGLNNQMLVCDGHLKVREYFYTQVIIWININLNHIDSTVILP